MRFDAGVDSPPLSIGPLTSQAHTKGLRMLSLGFFPSGARLSGVST